MNIPNVSNTNIITNQNNVKRTIINQVQANDTFEHAKKPAFNLENAMNELKDMKNLKGEQKFNDEKLELLKVELQKAPEKWDALQNIAQNPKMISSIVCDFIQKDTPTLNALNDLANLKFDDKAPRFSTLELKNIAGKLDAEGLNKVKPLAETKLGIDNIMEIAGNKDISNIDKLITKLNEITKPIENKLMSITFSKDKFDENAYMIRADLTDKSSEIALMDKKMNTQSIESIENYNGNTGKQYQIRKSNDFRTNTTSKVRLEVNPKSPLPLVTNEIRLVKDKNGNSIRKEYYELSDVVGSPNIKYVYPDGKEKIVSSASINPKTGITSVKKDMDSLNGTKTQYLYEDDPQGNRISDYQITDKNGNVLLKNSQAFEVLSNNKFISSKNDKSYEITVSDKEINVKDLQTKEISKLEFENYIDGDKEKLLKSLKQMPGEELIALGKTTKKLNGIDDTFKSTYAAKTKTIKSGDNLFTVLHELGHAKDYEKVNIEEKETLLKSIFNNPKINSVYEKEKAAFNKEFPNSQREHLSYFIENSQYKDSLQETIAESNALLNTRNTEDIFSVRSQYLQQYFPETIATLSKELDKQT